MEIQALFLFCLMSAAQGPAPARQRVLEKIDTIPLEPWSPEERTGGSEKLRWSADVGVDAWRRGVGGWGGLSVNNERKVRIRDRRNCGTGGKKEVKPW